MVYATLSVPDMRDAMTKLGHANDSTQSSLCGTKLEICELLNVVGCFWMDHLRTVSASYMLRGFSR